MTVQCALPPQQASRAEAAEEMLYELLASRLDVVLIPSQDADCAMRGGKIRAVQEQNCEWYRELCDRYSAHRSRPRYRRKHDTSIKREHTIAALKRIIDGDVSGSYAERLMPFIDKRVEEILMREMGCFDPAMRFDDSTIYELTF